MGKDSAGGDKKQEGDCAISPALRRPASRSADPVAQDREAASRGGRDSWLNDPTDLMGKSSTSF